MLMSVSVERVLEHDAYEKDQEIDLKGSGSIELVITTLVLVKI